MSIYLETNSDDLSLSNDVRGEQSTGSILLDNDSALFGSSSIFSGAPTSSGERGATLTGDAPGAFVGTLAQMATYLNSGYWAFSGYQGTGQRHWGVGATVTVNIQDLNTAERTLAILALNTWSTIANINFSLTSGAAQITYNNNGSGQAFCAQTVSGTALTSATIDISSDWGNPSVLNSYMWQTYLHETGHALGLGHQGAYNGSATYPGDAVFTNDSWQLSVMSYFSQTENTTTGASFAYVMTPQMVDILAMGQHYGLRSARTGDTTYGFNSNAGQIYSFSGTNNVSGAAFTIYDTGGIDTLDASGYSNTQLIDLRSGNFSNIGGRTGNIGIYTIAVIENGIGGTGSDTFYGNGSSNIMNGNTGFDTVNFTAARNTWNFVETNNYTVTNTANNAGTDTLISIERFAFSDFTVTDDFRGGNATTATINSNGQTRTGEIQFHGDRDWFATSMTAGQYYTIRMNGSPTSDGTLTDPLLRVYNSGSTQVASNDDAGIGFNSLLIWTPTLTGSYYLGAGRFNDSGVGTYEISIERTQYHAQGSWTSSGSGTEGWYVGDFTGDGRDDIFRFNPGVSGAEMFRSTGTGFVAAGSWSGSGSGTEGWYVGDFNADGRDDIFRFNPGVSGAEMFLSNGSTFVAGGSWTGSGSGDQGWYVGDFNGDGRSDVLRYHGGVAGAEVLLSTGTGFGAATIWTGSGNNGHWYVGDFNGDGRDDVMRYNPGVSGAEVFLSNGTSFAGPTSWTTAGSGVDGWYVGDFNGDGRDDVLRYNPGVSGAEVFLSNGTSFVAAGSWTGDGSGVDGWYVGNFDGDSTSDIFRYNPGFSGAEVYLV